MRVDRSINRESHLRKAGVLGTGIKVPKPQARLGSEVCPHAEMCNGVLQRFDETAMSL